VAGRFDRDSVEDTQHIVSNQRASGILWNRQRNEAYRNHFEYVRPRQVLRGGDHVMNRAK
jgi:hypothetical protein